MPTVYLGLGSNLGNRRKNLEKAIRLIQGPDIHIKKCSSIIETDPVGGPPQGKYLNAALKTETFLTPAKLLLTIQKIEKKLGRIRTVVNGPRTIDIDILLYDELILNTPHLTIPHPRMWQRDFVMRPLKEIAPEFCGSGFVVGGSNRETRRHESRKKK